MPIGVLSSYAYCMDGKKNVKIHAIGVSFPTKETPIW